MLYAIANLLGAMAANILHLEIGDNKPIYTLERNLLDLFEENGYKTHSLMLKAVRG